MHGRVVYNQIQGRALRPTAGTLQPRARVHTCLSNAWLSIDHGHISRGIAVFNDICIVFSFININKPS